jgi:hypothetical protein
MPMTLRNFGSITPPIPVCIRVFKYPPDVLLPINSLRSIQSISMSEAPSSPFLPTTDIVLQYPDDDIVLLTIPMGYRDAPSNAQQDTPPHSPSSPSSIPPLLSPLEISLNNMRSIPPLSPSDIRRYTSIVSKLDYTYNPIQFRDFYVKTHAVIREMLEITQGFHAFAYGLDEFRVINKHSMWMCCHGFFEGMEIVVGAYLHKRAAPLSFFHLTILQAQAEAERRFGDFLDLPGSTIFHSFGLTVSLGHLNEEKPYRLADWVPFIQAMDIVVSISLQRELMPELSHIRLPDDILYSVPSLDLQYHPHVPYFRLLGQMAFLKKMLLKHICDKLAQRGLRSLLVYRLYQQHVVLNDQISRLYSPFQQHWLSQNLTIRTPSIRVNPFFDYSEFRFLWSSIELFRLGVVVPGLACDELAGSLATLLSMDLEPYANTIRTHMTRKQYVPECSM